MWENAELFWPFQTPGETGRNPAKYARFTDEKSAFQGNQIVSGCAPEISLGRFSGAAMSNPSKRAGN
jgi:hypothetical protein